MLYAYPILSVKGAAHRTGPTTPKSLRVIAMLPSLAVLSAQPFAGLFALFGVLTNVVVVRGGLPPSVKIALMAAVTVVDVVAATAVRVLFYGL